MKILINHHFTGNCCLERVRGSIICTIKSSDFSSSRVANKHSPRNRIALYNNISNLDILKTRIYFRRLISSHIDRESFGTNPPY